MTVLSQLNDVLQHICKKPISFVTMLEKDTMYNLQVANSEGKFQPIGVQKIWFSPRDDTGLQYPSQSFIIMYNV